MTIHITIKMWIKWISTTTKEKGLQIYQHQINKLSIESWSFFVNLHGVKSPIRKSQSRCFIDKVYKGKRKLIIALVILELYFHTE